MTAKHRVILSALAVLAVCSFIFFMSAQPADESSVMSNSIFDIVVGIFIPDYNLLDADEQLIKKSQLTHIIRKLAHFTEFAVLGVTILNLLYQIAKANLSGEQETGKHFESNRYIPLAGKIPVAWLLATLYAATDEFHQLFVPGRGGLITDVCIDSAGVLTGVLITAAIIAFKQRKSS
ncbi:MAG: VanZ family protein [Coriobacteriales bacterium]|nr:VanZ family protein [Coriobacteriales bacterium]